MAILRTTRPISHHHAAELGAKKEKIKNIEKNSQTYPTMFNPQESHKTIDQLVFNHQNRSQPENSTNKGSNLFQTVIICDHLPTVQLASKGGDVRTFDGVLQDQSSHDPGHAACLSRQSGW